MKLEKKIIYLITSLGVGGAEAQVMRLAIRMQRRGWKISVVSLLPLDHYARDLQEAGITVLSLEMRAGRPDIRAIVRLARNLRTIAPTVVHTHMVHANILGRVTRLFARVPVLISTAHNIFEGPRWRELAYRLTDPLCDLTTQVSEAGMRRSIAVGAVPKNKIRFIANGINTEQFYPDSAAGASVRNEFGWQQQFIWLAVGRLAEAKDYPNMLHAFMKVYSQQPNARLMIAGKGDLMIPMQRIATDLGIADAVRFLGVRNDIPTLMNASDGYIMSSAWEGMPMVLLEASAAGVPIVATDVGGNCEILRDGENGYLVPPKDSDALALAMLRMMRLPLEQRECMGRVAREVVQEHYGIESVLNKWETLYSELLRDKGFALV